MFQAFLRGVVLVLTLANLSPASADETLDRELESDVVLRAMVDELARSRAELTLADMPRPYFIEYAIMDGAYAQISAALGAVTQRASGRSRSLRTDVRVGSYELDNTNFSAGGEWRGFAASNVEMPIEDDYDAIRQAIWWATDEDYKGVAEDFVRKLAFMQSKLIEDKPNDHSQEEPVAYFEERAALAVDEAPLVHIAERLSDVFRPRSELRESSVNVSAAVANKYLANTEGTRLRTPVRLFMVDVSATVQAADGMMLTDSRQFQALSLEELPPLEEMISACEAMTGDLLALRDAPLLDSYSGPVLVDAEPAAALFARQFASAFPGGQRDVGSRTPPDDFSKKLGKRILPKSVTVVDDPTRDTVEGVRAFGHYVYDDEGVRARPVTLVDGGRLEAQLMSRNPSKEFSRSTGHGRSLYSPRAALANLIVSAEDGADAAALKQELIEACEDEGLEYGIRVASLGVVGGGLEGGPLARRGRSVGNTGPLMTYKVYLDGREELVRGAELSGLNLKAFKRMLAVGDTLYVLNRAQRTGDAMTTVAAPGMLFEELDVGKIDRDFDKPPILPPPAAREQAAKRGP